MCFSGLFQGKFDLILFEAINTLLQKALKKLKFIYGTLTLHSQGTKLKPAPALPLKRQEKNASEKMTSAESVCCR